MDAINSQLGVRDYQDGEYGADEIYFGNPISPIFGVFYNNYILSLLGTSSNFRFLRCCTETKKST